MLKNCSVEILLISKTNKQSKRLRHYDRAFSFCPIKNNFFSFCFRENYISYYEKEAIKILHKGD